MKRKRKEEMFAVVYGAPPFMARKENKEDSVSEEEESEYPWNQIFQETEQPEMKCVYASPTVRKPRRSFGRNKSQ